MTPQELKNSILQLAIQGKLVEQRPEEGTGEELYQQIHAEKQKHIKAGTIKKEKPLPEITEDEKPFDVPESWQWERVGNVGSWSAGATPSRTNPQYYNGNIPWLKTGDLNDGYITQISESISEFALEKTSVRLNPIGSVLMAMYGATIGKLGILNIEATTNQACCACIPFNGINNKYLFYYLMANRTAFTKMGAGGAQPNISKEKIVYSLIPIPPLAEQKRIVAKIEELLQYVNRYEKAWGKLENFNKRFPIDMQKSVLQMAIQGKLVEQRPEEGTGEELYQQIQIEKQKLIKAGTIKKGKPLPKISEDEIPFDIPENWKWEKVGNIFEIIRGSSPRPKGSPLYWADEKTEFNWITIKDISDYTINGKLYQTHEYLTRAGAALSTYVDKEELIIAVSGSTTGKHCILGINGYIYDGLAAIINRTRIISSQYIMFFFDWVYEKLNSQKIGSAFPNINTDILKNTLIPLPPLAEQKRIVARLEEILPLCEKLK